MVKNLPETQERRVQTLAWEDPPEEGLTTHSSILAWEISWTEEPRWLQSTASQRVGHNWACTHTHSHILFGHYDNYLVFCYLVYLERFSWWLRWLSICLQCGRPRFDPWVGKIPWRMKWQSTPVLLPGKSHWQRSLVGYSPWGRKEPDMTGPCRCFYVNIMLNYKLLNKGAFIIKS